MEGKHIPTSTKMMEKRHSHPPHPLHPLFTTGRDHIFVWGSGMAADGPFASWRDWVPNAIFMMTEPELWNPYKEHHSVKSLG